MPMTKTGDDARDVAMFGGSRSRRRGTSSFILTHNLISCSFIKMKVKGPRVAATSEERNVPRCAKYYTSVQKLKSIELDAIGDRKNNVLLDLLRCLVKADKSSCQKESKLYEKCHASYGHR